MSHSTPTSSTSPSPLQRVTQWLKKESRATRDILIRLATFIFSPLRKLLGKRKGLKHQHRTPPPLAPAPRSPSVSSQGKNSLALPQYALARTKNPLRWVAAFFNPLVSSPVASTWLPTLSYNQPLMTPLVVYPSDSTHTIRTQPSRSPLSALTQRLLTWIPYPKEDPLTLDISYPPLPVTLLPYCVSIKMTPNTYIQSGNDQLLFNPQDILEIRAVNCGQPLLPDSQSQFEYYFTPNNASLVVYSGNGSTKNDANSRNFPIVARLTQQGFTDIRFVELFAIFSALYAAMKVGSYLYSLLHKHKTGYGTPIEDGNHNNNSAGSHDTRVANLNPHADAHHSDDKDVLQYHGAADHASDSEAVDQYATLPHNKTDDPDNGQPGAGKEGVIIPTNPLPMVANFVVGTDPRQSPDSTATLGSPHSEGKKTIRPLLTSPSKSATPTHDTSSHSSVSSQESATRLASPQAESADTLDREDSKLDQEHETHDTSSHSSVSSQKSGTRLASPQTESADTPDREDSKLDQEHETHDTSSHSSVSSQKSGSRLASPQAGSADTPVREDSKLDQEHETHETSSHSSVSSPKSGSRLASPQAGSADTPVREDSKLEHEYKPHDTSFHNSVSSHESATRLASPQTESADTLDREDSKLEQEHETHVTSFHNSGYDKPVQAKVDSTHDNSRPEHALSDTSTQRSDSEQVSSTFMSIPTNLSWSPQPIFIAHGPALTDSQRRDKSLDSYLYSGTQDDTNGGKFSNSYNSSDTNFNASLYRDNIEQRDRASTPVDTGHPELAKTYDIDLCESGKHNAKEPQTKHSEQDKRSFNPEEDSSSSHLRSNSDNNLSHAGSDGSHHSSAPGQDSTQKKSAADGQGIISPTQLSSHISGPDLDRTLGSRSSKVSDIPEEITVTPSDDDAMSDVSEGSIPEYLPTSPFFAANNLTGSALSSVNGGSGSGHVSSRVVSLSSRSSLPSQQFLETNPQFDQGDSQSESGSYSHASTASHDGDGSRISRSSLPSPQFLETNPQFDEGNSQSESGSYSHASTASDDSIGSHSNDNTSTHCESMVIADQGTAAVATTTSTPRLLAEPISGIQRNARAHSPNR